ncbi:hypothetical protein [Sphingomonas sp.]|uniref:hypothetical protein n=1 Tax=Sphingomonas sp. TaxID=28214 RepID=UPI0035BC8F71
MPKTLSNRPEVLAPSFAVAPQCRPRARRAGHVQRGAATFRLPAPAERGLASAMLVQRGTGRPVAGARKI